MRQSGLRSRFGLPHGPPQLCGESADHESERTKAVSDDFSQCSLCSPPRSGSTTDVLPAGELLVEADYITHPTSYESSRFQFFGP